MNILLSDKNFMVQLLKSTGYETLNILLSTLRTKKININSGSTVAVNEAILKENRVIIDTLLKYTDVNPFARSKNGVTPVHVACAKLDWATL